MLVPDVNRVILSCDSDESKTNKYWHRNFKEWRSSKDQQFVDSNFDLSIFFQVHYPDVERVEWLNKVPIEAVVVVSSTHRHPPITSHRLLLASQSGEIGFKKGSEPGALKQMKFKNLFYKCQSKEISKALTKIVLLKYSHRLQFSTFCHVKSVSFDLFD